MNKILVGLIVGAVLGIVDGATAWFTPAVRPYMLSIIIGSTMKGMIAGVAAGWFARRVQSVSKGVAFGFGVGLLLAFLVAAMPSATGEHYWWQIMLPGSVLGGVIGWATQRYGRPAPSRSVVSTALVLLSLTVVMPAYAGGQHEHAAAPSANAAFERLKGLAGMHTAAMMTPDGQATRMEYRVAANGYAVVETMFIGEPHEMMTIYTVDGEAVRATHYCSGGNQPVLMLNRARSSADRLVFDFVSITGEVKRNHINGVTFTFGENGAVEEVWSSSNSEDKVRIFYRGGR